MGIRVTNPGLFTTVQDEGRLGYQQFGVSPSGPMDARSFHIANILVGNKRGEGALEATFSGPTLEFTEDEVIAIVGADMQPEVNGKKVPRNAAIAVKAGDVLTMGFAVNGARAYIAFAGGLDIPLVMESKATLPGKHIGGLDGRKLQAGDEIGLAAPVGALPGMAERRAAGIKYPTDSIQLRAVPGPQDDAFSKEELRRFFIQDYTICNEFDRQGCRLETPDPLHHLVDGNIISDGIAIGSVQVPTNGQPIIMLSDRQTVGGYTKIATVISTDLSVIAQARPGMKVSFRRMGVQFAQFLYKRELQELNELEERMRNL